MFRRAERWLFHVKHFSFAGRTAILQVEASSWPMFHVKHCALLGDSIPLSDFSQVVVHAKHFPLVCPSLWR